MWDARRYVALIAPSGRRSLARGACRTTRRRRPTVARRAPWTGATRRLSRPQSRVRPRMCRTAGPPRSRPRDGRSSTATTSTRHGMPRRQASFLQPAGAHEGHGCTLVARQLAAVDRLHGRAEPARGVATHLGADQHRAIGIKAHQVDLIATDRQVAYQDPPAERLQEALRHILGRPAPPDPDSSADGALGSCTDGRHQLFVRTYAGLIRR